MCPSTHPAHRDPAARLNAGYATRTLALALSLVGSAVLLPAATFTDTFSGPTLDAGWTVVGNAGNFSTNPGYYTVSTEYPQSSGLARTLGSGDSEVTIHYGSVTGLAGANARLDVTDGAGQFFIIMAEAPRNGGWGPNIVIDWNNGTGANRRLLSVPLPSLSITGLSFNVRWTESTQTFAARYKLNEVSAGAWSAEYSAVYGVASSANRTVTPYILSWDAGAGITTATLDSFVQTNGGAASVPDAGHTPATLGVILAGLATLRRRLQP
jgi:hypothetical protein